MKKVIVLLILIFSITNSFAQIKIKTYSEQTKEGFIFYADNSEPCEVSLKIKFKLKNLKSSAGIEKIFLLPPNSKKIELSILTSIKKGRKSIFSTIGSSNYGNHFDNIYDKNYEYYLPYKKGKNVMLSQGYNGTTSHQNKNQLDFRMSIGTEIVATRNGTVIKLVDVNNRTCAKEECKKYNNYIIIAHDDGTFAEYVHIKRKGSKVEVGDKVKAGQLIALSGNVGWSTGPHLHFSVFLQKINNREYIKTKFKIGDGSITKQLVEKEFYERNYD